MGRLDWLPPRSSREKAAVDVPFVQETTDMVRVFILQLARGAWSTLARLLQLACLSLDFKPLLAHEMANSGATGVVLDILCQAPRHHPAWRALSTAGLGLLAALVRCEGGTEAAQPQALRLLLAMLESDLTCGPARQAVATVLHCIVAQRTVHRDKLLAVGALPVLLRVLRRLDVLCDLVAVQELLWTLVSLTDEGALPLPVPPGSGGVGGGTFSSGVEGCCLQPLVAERLVPLLFLYGMPWHAQHGHLAALTIRALHVHVAGYDAGKDTLRAAGVLSALVDNVRRHGAPYVAAVAATPQYQGRRGGGAAAGAVTVAMAPAAAAGSGGTTRVSFAVGTARPPPHAACDIHADGGTLPNGAANHGPYSGDMAVALGAWTPWERLMAVLLISGMVPGVVPAPRRRFRRCRPSLPAAAAGTPRSGGTDGAESTARDGYGASTPSPLDSDDDEDDDDKDEVFGGSRPYDGGLAPPALITLVSGSTPSVYGTQPQQQDKKAQQQHCHVHQQQQEQSRCSFGGGGGAVSAVDGARVVCYGLLLPLLADAGEEATAGGGAGAAAAAVGGALLRRRLCPLREALSTLRTLLCDCEDNQAAAAALGLPELLVQLVAHGDMGLAWQAAEAAVYLAGGAPGAALVAAGAAEEMAHLLEESAELLHGLTLRKQIQVQKSAMTTAHAGDHHHRHSNSTSASATTSFAAAGHQQPHRRESWVASASASAAAAAAAAAPPPLTEVHVRPHRTAANSNNCNNNGGGGLHPVRRPQRLYLVGRVPLDFTTSGSCMYGAHDAASYCDYCPPSAAIKVLLRLMAAAAGTAPAPPDTGGAAAETAVCRRFATAGGMYGALLLLHHEAAGVHHSKLAASLLTLLDLLLAHEPGAQDELRLAGGMGVLSTMLGSLMRPGVMDVYQLRVSTCRTIRLALRGNAANKLAAREHGLLPLLVSLLTALVQQRKASHRASEVVMDDTGPLTGAVLAAAAAAAQDSPGTQEALVALGLLHPLSDLLRDERLDVEVRTDAVLTLAAVVDKYGAGQAGALALGVVQPAVAWLERCCMDAGAAVSPGAVTVAAAARGDTVKGGTAPSLAELAEPAAALASLLGALLRGGGNAHAKSVLVSAGALRVLLQLLRSQALAAATSPPAAAAGGTLDAAGVTALVADVLAALVENDTDLQNELVSQGGLTATSDVVRAGGAAAPAALKLLSAVLRANTYAKNSARQAGLPAALVAAVRRCGLLQSDGAAAAAAALAELAAGNHANQEAVAVQGGLEIAVDLMRDAFAALPLRVLTGGSGGGAAAAVADEGSTAAANGYGDGEGTSGAGGSSTAAAAASAAAGAVPYTMAEAVEGAAAATSLSRLLRALLGLVCACVELNVGNQSYVRELGGVSLLGALLLTTVEALTAQPPLSWTPYTHNNHDHQQRGRAQGEGSAAVAAADAVMAARLRDATAAARGAVSSAVAAACNAVVAVTRDNGANLARLEEQPGLAVALFKLLVAADASTSLAGALAIEWLVVRSRAHLDAPSREVFELNLIDVLVLALYVPYAPLKLTPQAPAAPAAAANVSSHAARAAAQKQQQQPWYAVVRALMPVEGLSAAVVRDAATVLTAVVDTADSLEAQRRAQQQQQQGTGSGSGSGSGKTSTAAAKSLVTTSHGSLPALEAAPVDPLASDHNTGLAVSNLLAGPAAAAAAGAGAAGPGSQAWWAELAGSAAPAFQRVTNGALVGAPSAAAANGAAPSVAAAAAAAAAAGAVAAGRGAAPLAQPPAGLYGSTAAAAQDRRRQVAWMLFLLAAKSSDNRARIRWLVRASLSPLAQQLANAELCRAQLEAAAAAPLERISASGSGSGAAGGGVVMLRASSAAIEGASSLQGRLPISTAAIEDLGGGIWHVPSPLGGPLGAQYSTVPVPPLPLSPAGPLAPAGPEGSQPQHSLLQHQVHHGLQAPKQHHQEHQHHRHDPQQQQQQQHNQHGAQDEQVSLPAHSPPLPPQPQSRPPSRPTSSSSGFGGAASSAIGPAVPLPAGPGHTRTASAGVAAGSLHGRLYGATASPASPAAALLMSKPAAATSRDSYTTLAADVAPTSASGGGGVHFTRLSRTGSGSGPIMSPGGDGGAAAAAAGANGTQRVSLTGAVAGAFAPVAIQGFVTVGASPSRLGLHAGAGAPVEAVAAATSAALPPTASERALHPQISGGGGSSVMSDDDELAMIQQEVALLANTTSVLASSSAMAAGGGGGIGASRGGGVYRSAGTAGNSPAASPSLWGAARR